MPGRFPVSYWGSVSYYQKMHVEKSVLLEIHETCPKQTLRNRCTILTANGMLDLTVPVVRPNGSKTITKDILIDNTTDWQKIHWRAIQSAYASSPFFDHYGMEIYSLLYLKETNLVLFNEQIQRKVCQWLDLGMDFTYSDTFQKIADPDFLSGFKHRESQVDYVYQQVFTSGNGFVPDLSVLDAVLNLGPMARKILVRD